MALSYRASKGVKKSAHHLRCIHFFVLETSGFADASLGARRPTVVFIRRASTNHADMFPPTISPPRCHAATATRIGGCLCLLCMKALPVLPTPTLFVRPFLMETRYELFHEVHGVKHGTAPTFWENHALSVKGGFARVGFLSMKSFNSKGVSAPTWGPGRSIPDDAKA